jgi:putative membrane protein
MTTTDRNLENKSTVGDWLVRLIKGVMVGIGFIVPGLSGGVLAVVFGLYEPLMRFLANLRVRFVKNLLFFIPVGIGGLLGVVAFSAVVDFAFTNYAAQFTWLFVGFISGTFPSLYRTAGKQGRKSHHWMVLVAAAAGILLFMRWMESVSSVTLSPSFPNWLLSGALIGLGVVVPGMSPSNFLIYLGLYQPMASGIRHLDLGVIIPLGLGLVICVYSFARLVSWLFRKFYAFMYHFILGIVVGSTLAIIPGGVKGWGIAACVLLFAFGALCSYGLARLDEKHPHESII